MSSDIDYDFDRDERDEEAADEEDLQFLDEPPAGVRRRRPCPMCGGMIVVTARKCRFCGEVFERGAGSGGLDAKFVNRFRREVHALGGFWIFMGVLQALFAIGVYASRDPAAAARFGGMKEVLMIVAAVFTAVYLLVGVLTCIKSLPAIYVGLVLTYLALAGYLFSLVVVLTGAPPAGALVCVLIIFAIWVLINTIVVVQGHRVIGWASRLREAGLPLTVRPEEVL